MRKTSCSDFGAQALQSSLFDRFRMRVITCRGLLLVSK